MIFSRPPINGGLDLFYVGLKATTIKKAADDSVAFFISLPHYTFFVKS
jgi:hypothetical protein